MSITSTWTTPSTLDRNNGDVLGESYWDNAISNELYLWDTLHNFARQASVLSFLIGTGDTNLYRGAANQLKTDDAFVAVDNIIAKLGGAGQISIGDSGGSPMVTFGSAGDTNLYRSAANTLKTDDAFIAVDNITAKLGGAGQIVLGDSGGVPTVLFGSGGDTNLYRSSANVLKTDDSMIVTGDLVVLGNATAVNATARLAQTVLGSAAASITFSSIPATYRNLRLVIQARSSGAVVGTELRIRFNNDTGSSYTSQYHWAYGTNVAADGPATTTQGLLGTIPGTTGLANLRAVADVTIADYAGAYYKSLVSSFHGQSASSAIFQAVGTTGCFWASTVAINRIDLFLASGNLDTGTVVTLYGEP